ncbi:MAG: immunoglobulin domain-containing protein [Sedimentisphaerales bacterium]|nr:immunoglobulin domain-containing protein [Sedimentisphaerales bacterium]
MRQIGLTMLGILMLAWMAAPADAATVAYWRFEEGPAGALVDHGGQGDGTYYPAVVDYSGNGYELSAWSVAGWANSEYRTDVGETYVGQTAADNNFSVKNAGDYPGMFTGPEDFITKQFEPSQWTVEVTFKAESGGWRTFVGRDSVGTNDTGPGFDTNRAAFYLQARPNNYVGCGYCDVAGYWHDVQSPINAITTFDFGSNPNGVGVPWYAMAAVNDGTLLTLYLKNLTAGGDYVQIGQTDLTLSGTPDTTLIIGEGSGSDWTFGTWTVGRGMYNSGHGDRAYGYIDEVRISDTALEVKDLLFYEKLRAHDPTPAHQAARVTTNVTFSWNTALDPADPDSGVNALVDKHRLYMQKSLTDPNWDVPVEIDVTGDTASYGPVAIGNDVQGWRWRVDEVLSDDPVDPNVLTGPTWTFDTRPSVPEITTQPSFVVVDSGDPAAFTIVAESISTAHYAWKKVNPDGEDPNVGSDSDTLSFASATVAEEGLYYCVVSNDSLFTATSDQAGLAIKRTVAYWPLDGSYIDASGEGHDADPNGTPTFVEGYDGTANGAAEVTDQGGWATAGNWNPSGFSNQLTVSFWMRWDGTNNAWQTFIAKRVGAFNADNVLWQVSAAFNLPHLWFQTPSSNVFEDNVLQAGAWQHVVATFDGTTARLYFNGVLRSSDDTWQFGNGVDSTIVLGAANPDGGAPINGALDEIRFLNYAMDELSVAQMYSNMTGESVCAESYRPSATYDYNGDCILDLEDIATFVGAWLDCGLLPDCVE